MIDLRKRGHKKPASDEERFKAVLSRCKELSSGCVIYQGACGRGGYPKLTIMYKQINVVRYLWEALNGPLPEGMQLNHTCHNAKCVNPYHVYPGTAYENSQDMINAGRHRNGSTKGEHV